MNFKSFLASAACLAFALTFGPFASAVIIAPGTGSAIVPEGNPGGSATLLETMTSPFLTANYSGSLVSSVYSDPANPLGGLTFTYELFNDPGSTDSLGRLTVNGYNGFVTNVSAEDNGPNDVISLGADRSANGDVIGFNWTDTSPFTPPFLGPGHDSRLLVIETDASSHMVNVAAVIDGISVNVHGFSPARSVPDGGTTVALLGVALLGLAALTKKSNKRVKPRGDG